MSGFCYTIKKNPYHHFAAEHNNHTHRQVINQLKSGVGTPLTVGKTCTGTKEDEQQLWLKAVLGDRQTTAQERVSRRIMHTHNQVNVLNLQYNKCSAVAPCSDTQGSQPECIHVHNDEDTINQDDDSTGCIDHDITL